MSKKLNNKTTIQLTTSKSIHSMKKFDNSYLNEKGRLVLRKKVKEAIGDMKHHFKEDKWDISINSILDEVTQSVLPSIDWIVITEVMSAIENLSVQSKDSGLYFTLNKRRKKI